MNHVKHKKKPTEIQIFAPNTASQSWDTSMDSDSVTIKLIGFHTIIQFIVISDILIGIIQKNNSPEDTSLHYN